MSEIVSFNLDNSNTLLKEYVDDLKNKRSLSGVINELLVKRLIEEKSIKKLKEELIKLKKDYSSKKIEINKNIEKNKKLVKEVYDFTSDSLKEHYSGSKKIKDVQLFINMRARRISILSGEDEKKIMNEILKGIKK